MQSQRELEGLHRKVIEIEALRAGEDKIVLPGVKNRAGLQIHTLQLADMVESVKSAILANKAKTSIKPLRSGDAAKANSSKREEWHNLWLAKIRAAIYDCVDSVVGNGFGFIKGVYTPWDPEQLKKRDDETDQKYNRRIRALKQKWGPPFSAVSPHVLTMYPRYGVADKVSENLEHSWRPKIDTYAKYQVDSDSDARAKSRGQMSANKVSEFDKNRAQLYGSIGTGQPEEILRPLPYGQDTTTMCLVTEYWNESIYQVYVNRQLLYEEENPQVAYFLARGRTTSSKDPDKIGISVAEALRINEPTINRTLTNMAEAVELQVNQPLTVELPQGSPDFWEPQLGSDNNPKVREFEFRSDKVKAMPPGAKVVRPYEGTEAAYGAMPMIELLLQLMGQHGVAPIFKGMPPGAAGSGYRDNSLYMMAKAQFEYIIDQLEEMLADYLRWMEDQIVALGVEVWLDDLKLTPKDIEDWPAKIEVTLDPMLPQNLIAEGQFWMEAAERGFTSRRQASEVGLKQEQPEEIERERRLEQAQDMLWPLVIQEAMNRLGIGAPDSPPPPPALQDEGSGLVDAQGNPLAPSRPTGPGGAQQMMSAAKANERGPSNAGPGRGASQPPNQPATTLQTASR